MMDPSGRARDPDAVWRPLLARLRAQGFEVEVTAYAAPVQLEGRVPSGPRFYYRCRWETCTLGVGGDDPADVAEWEGERFLEGEYSAGHLAPAEAVRVLLALHSAWMRDRAPAGQDSADPSGGPAV